MPCAGGVHSQRVLAEEFLHHDLNQPAAEVADPGGFNTADVRLVGAAIPDLIDVILIGRNLLDFIVNGLLPAAAAGALVLVTSR